MEILIFLGIYVAELACYWLGLKLLFDVKIKAKVWSLMGILLPLLIVRLPFINADEKDIFISFGAIIVVFAMIDGRISEKVVKLLLVLVILECANTVFMKVCETIEVLADHPYKINLVYVIVKLCTIVCLMLLYCVKINFKYFININIDAVIYVIIGIIAVSMMICIAILDYVTGFIDNDIFVVFINILIGAIFVSIFLLGVFLVYLKNTHDRMEQMLKTEKILKESQVSYYKQMLKQETDTKRYRHDMMNHLNLLLTKLSRDETKSARLYLENVLGGFQKIQYTHYTLGNEMVDTILNYFFGMLPEHTEVLIESKFPVEFDMEDTDICTIFSNLFQNIVEEISDHKDQDATIIIRGERGKSYAKYYIKNTLFSEIGAATKAGLPISNKEDHRNHGIGMLNVKDTIEKNGGTFAWYREDGYFCVDLVLKLKVKTI